LIAVPTAAGLASRLAVKHLERRGRDPGTLLKKTGIDRAALSLGSRIPVASQIAFLDLVGRALEDDWIGLTLASDFDLREMGLLYYVAASSGSLGEALQRLERYVQLGNEALVVRIRKGSVCRIGLSYTQLPRYRDRHQMELFAVSLLRMCRQLVGQRIMPLSTSFTHHRSGDLRDVRRLFGDDVRFDAADDEICLEGTLLDAPVTSADPFLNDIMVKSCEEALARRSSNVSALRTRVENAIAPMLPHREASASAVARQLGMSERTLARRLKAEGTTFEKILDELRRELAIRYLAERDLPMSQIAWLLGYNSPSALTHACRRLTGKSPSAHRRDSGSELAIPA
jgi:AraC-like DNA-binding protein